VRSYYSTFIPGLLQPVQEALKSALPDAKILLALDGLIAYESAAKAEIIRKLPFVTNSFFIFKRFEGPAAETIPAMAARILEDVHLNLESPVKFAPRSTFRIVTSLANQLVPLDNGVMQKLERRVTEKLGIQPHRSKPDFEFWLAQRSEGHGFFALRLSHHQAYDKSLQKGELRPELANILCRLSEPSPKELFLDPFCGSGAIPIQRAPMMPDGLIIASDIDPEKVAALKARVKTLDLTRRIVVRAGDGLDLSRYEDGSIHKIVTDPPWGHFAQTSTSIEEFYEKMMGEFVRVTRAGGLMVILTAETAALEASLDRYSPRITLVRSYNILLSGKKARVYVAEKKDIPAAVEMC
jgi:tRNA (guanine6-N2)-methyltransferase